MVRGFFVIPRTPSGSENMKGRRRHGWYLEKQQLYLNGKKKRRAAVCVALRAGVIEQNGARGETGRFCINANFAWLLFFPMKIGPNRIFKIVHLCDLYLFKAKGLKGLSKKWRIWVQCEQIYRIEICTYLLKTSLYNTYAVHFSSPHRCEKEIEVVRTGENELWDDHCICYHCKFGMNISSSSYLEFGCIFGHITIIQKRIEIFLRHD